jgi:hypothetical protein
MTQDQVREDPTIRREELRREELVRFREYTAGELPRGPTWKFVVSLGQNSDMCFSKIMEVIERILSTSYTSWPNSDQWQEVLPGWFLDATPKFTNAEYEALISETPEENWDTLPWDYESWLDAIHVREWHWWSYARKNGTLDIHLSLTGWPAHLETFEHILHAAGAKVNFSASL